MKKTNKTLLALSSLLLAFGLFACNNNNNSFNSVSDDNVSDSTNSETNNSEGESVSNTSSPLESEVVQNVYEISLNETNVSLIVGQSQTVTATLTKNGETCNDVIEWVSNNPDVVTVENGVVTALSAGNATITASAHGKKATLEVEVEEEIGDLFLIVDPEKADLEIGETLQLNTQLLGGDNPSLTYYSSDDSVATVDSNGLVTAHSNGDAIISIVHGDVNDGVIAYCEIKVQSSIQLIFPELPQQEYFVGDVIDTNAMIKADGMASQEGIVISGTGFTVSGDEITLTEDGPITITVSYEGQQSISREIMSYHKVSNAQDWANINNDLAGYYKLTNNINFNGEALITIAHYADQMNSSTTGGFSGVFDGQGYAIMNYSKSIGSKGSTSNSSPFGQIDTAGVIKNVNFVNGTIDNYIGGGIATINNGTIENCYADVYVKFNPGINANSKNNPIGGIASKNYNTIKNCIAVVRLADGIDTTMIGAIAGRNASDKAVLTNCYALSSLGICESATPGNAPTNPFTGTITNVSVVADLDSLNDLVEANDNFNKSLWNVVEGRYPVVGEKLNLPINVNQTEYTVFAGTNVTIESTSVTKVSYTLKQAIEGVSVDGNGKVTVAETVLAGTDIEVVLSNGYSDTVTVTITVNALSYSVDASAFKPLSFNLIKGYSAESEFSTEHNVVIKYNNQVYVGESVQFVSSNTNVVTVDASKVTAVGDGTATISVLADGSEIYSFEVNVEMWTAVKTTADFLAMGTDANTLKGKYKLVNNIDFNGADIPTFSSYTSRNSRQWWGVFDGQGYTVSNFRITLGTGNGSDAAIFGYMGVGSVVKNVNFIGAKTMDRSAVVGSWVEGTIENVFVEVTYISAANTVKNQNNPASTIAAKMHGTGILRNSIAVVNATNPTVVETHFGSVFGKTNNAGAIVENCMSITSLNAPVVHDTSVGGTVTNVTTHKTIADFYANAQTSSFDASVWTFAEGKYPHVGTMANMMSATNTEYDVYANNVATVKANSSLPVYYKLATEVANVTVNETTGEVSVGSVPVGTDIEVIAYNLYTNETVTLTVTVKAATVSVDDTNYTPLSFDVISGVSVTSEYNKAHNIVLKQNGEVYTGNDVEFVSSNTKVATADATNVTAIGDGNATITIKVGGADLYSFDVTVSVWTPVRTIAEFEAIEQNWNGKYKLLNNLDYNGGYVKTIAHYASTHSVDSNYIDGPTEGFQGIFDGNGYSIMNFAGTVQMNGTTAANCSPFGHIGNTGVVKNLNVVNGTISTRIAGGIATVNYGTIENCYVDVYVTYNKNHENNNPIGGIVSKNYNTVKNCVAVVTLADGIYDGSIGTIAGRNWEGDDYIVNCYGLSIVGITESGTPGNGYTANSAGTNISNSAVYTTLAELNAAIANDATFDKTLWTIAEGKYPHVGQMANIMSVVNSEVEAFANSTSTVFVKSPIAVYYKLATEVANVSVNATTGLVTIGEVPGGTDIEVVAYNLYTNEIVTITLTVLESSYEAVNPNATMTINDKLVGEKVAHNVVVNKDGQPYNGSEITFTSNNESVATVDATNITVNGEGSATITVAANGVTLTTIAVNATMIWIPVRTTGEFLAMGTNGTTMSKKYKLMTNLDFAGATIRAFSSYKTMNDGSVSTKFSWTGMFDGQGYTVSNFTVSFNQTVSSDRDAAIFGYMSAGSVVRNVNFVGVKGSDRTAVVSNWCDGTIENVYVEFNYTAKGGNRSNTNPGGIVVSKARPTAVVSNCIVVLAFASGVTSDHIGGVIGLVSTGAVISDCLVVTSDTQVQAVQYGTATLTNCAKYADMATLLSTATLTNFDTNVWSFDTTNNKVNVKVQA